MPTASNKTPDTAATGDDDKENPGAGKPAGTSGEAKKPTEIGGPKGPEPTRFGDWEVGGRCTDF